MIDNCCLEEECYLNAIVNAITKFKPFLRFRDTRAF